MTYQDKVKKTLPQGDAAEQYPGSHFAVSL